MTVSNTYLEGTHEPFSETVRALIGREWAAANTANITPKILSDFGHGANPGALDEPLKSNDFMLKDDEAAIIFKEGNTLTRTFDNNFIEFETTVFIDIFGSTKIQYLIKEEINRIIFENQPNSTKRIKKSDNSNDSAIINIKQNAVDWRKIGSINDVNLEEQLAGQVECIWEQQKT